MVTGGLGMGKSALLAAWLARREAAGAGVPHHFIRRGESDTDDAAKLVGSLVAQLELRFPGQREQDGDARIPPTARLEAALRRVSQHELIPRGERLVVLIDGLDEYDPPASLPPGHDPLAAFLPRALPRGVSLVCASRPRHLYADRLATRGAVRLDLDEPSAAADNEATVRAFWEQAAPQLGLDARFVDEAVTRAGGNLQHAAMLRLHLEGLLPDQPRRVEGIPRGLAALIASAWERISTDPSVVEGLGVLCAAREALTVDELAAVLGWAGVAQRQAFVRGARELLLERERAVPEYRLHHDSIRAHVAGEIGEAALRGHHRALAQQLARWPAPAGATTARRYALRYALTHRAEAGEWADAWRLVADMSFIEAKCRELGVHDAEADVARAAERCRASGDAALRERFDDLARALSRESHWLRAAPEATAALVWNRLRRSGWSAEDVDQQLRLPAGASFLRVRHWATRESPEFVRDLIGHSRSVLACAVTPDGRRVVSGGTDGTLKVWDLATGREVATLQGHAGRVTACAVTLDGRRLVSGSEDRTLKVWDLETGQEMLTLQGHAGQVNACAVTPDGRRVVSGSDDSTLKVWDLATGQEVATLQGHAGLVLACAVTPDGRRAVSGSEDHTLKVWDLATGRGVATLQGHAGLVRACAVTPDGRRAVSGSEDHTLKVWDLETGRPISILEGHVGMVLACAVTPDGRHVVSGSEDRTLKVWDLETKQAVGTLEGHAGRVRACAAMPAGQRVVSAGSDRTLKVWDVAMGQGVATTLKGHAGRVRAITVTPDGKRAVSAGSDRTLKVWDVATGGVARILEGHAGRVSACAVTADGRRVVSGAWDKALKIWDLETGRVVATLQGHADKVLACAATPDGRRVVSGSEDHTLKVWDLETGRPISTLEGHAAWVLACAVTPDGRRLVSGSEDKTLKVWDLETGRAVATLQGHAGPVTACVVTPDGRHVVSASEDKTLKVWDLTTGRPASTLQGHVDRVNACALTPDGRRVVSGDWDSTLKVWDLATGACLFTHHASASITAVAATSTTLIAGDSYGAVWFLDWPSPHPRERSRHASPGADLHVPLEVTVRPEIVAAAPPEGSLANVSGTSPIHAVFVIHADVPAETAFVRSELVTALQLPPDRILLSSELPLGQTVIGALEQGVLSSRVTVLVLSPAFLRDTWASFGENVASFAAGNGGALVPLLLTDCPLPLRLDLLVPLDCRDPQRRPDAFRRLRELVSPVLPGAERAPTTSQGGAATASPVPAQRGRRARRARRLRRHGPWRRVQRPDPR